MTRPSSVGRGRARDKRQKSGTRCLRSPGLAEPSFCPTQLLFSLPHLSFQAILGSSPGTWLLEVDAVMETRTEASRGPELLRTLHTYSPESAGDTWCSRSLEPWVWSGAGQTEEQVKMSTRRPGRLGARVPPPIQVCEAPHRSVMPPIWAEQTRTPSQHLSHFFSSLYLMTSGEAPRSLVPCDLGVGLSRDHTVQIQGLSFSHV